MSKFYNLKTFPQCFGGHVFSKDIVIRHFNYGKQYINLKILIRQHWGKKWPGRRPSCLLLFWALVKGTRTFNFRQNRPPPNVLGPTGPYDHF